MQSRFRRSFRLLTMVALVLSGSSVAAGELGDLLRAALDNPSIAAAKGQAVAADFQTEAARGLYFGQATALYGLHRYSEPRVVGQFSVPVRGDVLAGAGLAYVLPIDVFGQVAAAVDKAGGEAAAARLGYRRQQLAKLHQTLGAYCTLYALELRRTALVAYRGRIESLVARLENEVKLGRSAPVQSAYARSQSYRLQSDESQLAGDIAATQASLAEATGVMEFVPRVQAVPLPRWQDVDSADALAVKVARARQASAEAAQREARANLLPRLTVDAGYSYVHAGNDIGGGTRDDWGIGFNLSLPLGPTAFRQADAAGANRVAAEDATRASMREAESAIVALRAQYRAAASEIKAMEAETAYRQEIVDVEREMHQLGNQTLENLFLHEDELLQARTRLAQAQARAAAAWSGLQMLAGTEPVVYIDVLDKAGPAVNENRKVP